MKKKLALFASGSGSNAENVYNYFLGNEQIEITALVCNKSDAGVWDRFKNIEIEKILISKNDLSDDNFLHRLENIDYVILAGFLLLIPKLFIHQFPNRIINIHPSLLPKYGGKGMYGDYVHQAVMENKEKETGITIHLVNEEYDKGTILFQSIIRITEEDDLNSIKQKIHQLEHDSFPKTIEKYIENFDS